MGKTLAGPHANVVFCFSHRLKTFYLDLTHRLRCLFDVLHGLLVLQHFSKVLWVSLKGTFNFRSHVDDLSAVGGPEFCFFSQRVNSGILGSPKKQSTCGFGDVAVEGTAAFGLWKQGAVAGAAVFQFGDGLVLLCLHFHDRVLQLCWYCLETGYRSVSLFYLRSMQVYIFLKWLSTVCIARRF